ncbi:MAG: hypothetical protein WAT78_16095 [Rhizobiaceae bacterium]
MNEPNLPAHAETAKRGLRVTVDEIMARLSALQDDLESQFAERRKAMSVIYKDRRAVFDDTVRALHKSFRLGIPPYVLRASLLVVLTMPFILAVIVPLLLLDLFVSVYQAVCFPVYGLKKVPRGDFIVFDREQLGYLNAIEKLNCGYCSYANGLLAWAREVAGRTESYWCPLKHARRLSGMHAHYPAFADFGDGKGWREKMDATSFRQSAGEPKQG